MVSGRVGQATLRSSARTSLMNSPGLVRFSLSAWRGVGACRRWAFGLPSAVSEPCRCNIRFVSRFIAIDQAPGVGGEQGRRDSNPQPAVLETAALPVELLPYGFAAQRDESSRSPKNRLSGKPHPALAGLGGEED